jgi:hypothetical protein
MYFVYPYLIQCIIVLSSLAITDLWDGHSTIVKIERTGLEPASPWTFLLDLSIDSSQRTDDIGQEHSDIHTSRLKALQTSSAISTDLSFVKQIGIIMLLLKIPPCETLTAAHHELLQATTQLCNTTAMPSQTTFLKRQVLPHHSRHNAPSTHPLPFLLALLAHVP